MPRSRRALSLVLSLAFALGSACAAPATANPKETPMRLRQVAIMDPNGYERPMPSGTLLIPDGWTASGGIYYDRQNLCVEGPNVNWQALSPDGTQRLAALPNFGWYANTQGTLHPMGCPPLPFTAIGQVAESVVSAWPQAQILSLESDPDIAAHLARFIVESLGEPYMKSWSEQAEVRFSFVENGRPMRGILSLQANFAFTRSVMGISMGLPPLDTVGGGTTSVFAYTAPEAAYNEGPFRLAILNWRADPEWSARTLANRRENFNRSQAIIRDLVDKQLETSRYVSDLSQRRFNDNWEAGARQNREFGELLKGVETWDADVPGGTVELPAQYPHAWQLEDGSFVLSDDPNFDPNRDLKVRAKRLKTTR
jgi:hypothetical protein